MELPSISTIGGVIFYGVVASIIASIIWQVATKLINGDSGTFKNKQSIKGNGVINVVQSKNTSINGGVNYEEKGKEN